MQADPLSTLDAGRGMIETTSSQFRENLLEHVFIAEVLQECALVRRQKVAVLRAEVDEDGYDLVLELGSFLRHVQLKSRYGGAKPSHKALDGLNPKLGGRIGGCVVLMYWRAKDGRIRLTYRWWGSGPGEAADPIPDHMTLGQMEIVNSTADLTTRLFGPVDVTGRHVNPSRDQAE